MIAIITSVWTVDNEYSKQTIKGIPMKNNQDSEIFLNDYIILTNGILCDKIKIAAKAIFL